MKLNTISSSDGAKKKSKRVGRGIGCGSGKTCKRGHKGQKSRSGGFRKTSFEGGQMPLQRRVPKFGFTSYKATITAEITLSLLDSLLVDEVSVPVLINMNVIPHNIKFVKVINTGDITRAVSLKGVRVTKAAMEKITQAGGKVEA